MITTDYRQMARFRKERFNPIILAESDTTRVILACFEPDQFIPTHAPPVDLTVAIIEGEGELLAGDERQAVAPGTVAFIPAGEARGVRAATRLIALFTVTPPPTEADHRDVVAGLEAAA